MKTIENKKNDQFSSQLRLFLRKWQRDEFWSNWFWALLACVIVGVILCIVVLCTRNSEGAWVSILKAGSPFPCPEKFPLGVHIFLGILNTIIIAPIIIAAVTTSIQYWIKRILIGEKRYNHLKGHYVLIGYNKYSASIINNRLGRKNDETNTLVILTAINPKMIRAELRSLLPKSIEERVIIYAGDPQSEDQITSLRLPYAKSIYVTLDGNEWDSAYTRAMSILPLIAKYTQERSIKDKKLLPVNILINDDKAYAIAQTMTLPKSFNHYDGKQNLDVHIYNFYENWARLLWSYKGLKDVDEHYVYDSLDFEVLDSSEKFVHLVVVGYNSMGKALVNEAIRVCHYPNYDAKTKKGKTIITIIDPQAASYKRDFDASYPSFEKQVKDIYLEFINAPIEDMSVRDKISEWAKDENRLLTIAICITDSDTAMQMALNLPEEVYCPYTNLELDYDHERNRAKVKENNSRTHILVRQTVRNTIQELVDANSKHYANLKIFGSYQDGLNLEFLDDNIAVCINGLYCNGYDKNIEKMIEIEEWDVHEKYNADWLEQWYDSSNTSMENKQKTRYQIDMYRSIFAYLKENGVNIDERKIVKNKELVEQLAEVEHRRFIADVTLLGYRQRKDNEWRIDDVKIHNCIDDYKVLSETDQLKDHVVIKACPVLKQWEKILLY